MDRPQNEISKASRKMLIESLRESLNRKNRTISNGDKPYLPDEYYNLVEEQVEKYDTGHNQL